MYSVLAHEELQECMCLCVCVCSVAKSCLILCDPMDYNTTGFPVLHYLLEFAQTHVHWVDDAIQPSHPLLPLFLLPSVFPSTRVFSSGSALCIRWPSIGVSASAPVLPMSIQDWFPLGVPGLISLQSKGLAKVFSSTYVTLRQICKVA